MKLSDLIEKHPGIEIASSKDNEAILSFFENVPMKGKGLELSYLRSPDFFSFLKLQSNKHFVFVYKDKNQILALGSLSIRKAFINGKLETLGYLGDLRVRPQLNSTRAWRDFYNDLMQCSSMIDELHNVRFFTTVMIDSNLLAKKALVSQSRMMFQYSEISKYKMVNILARYKKVNANVDFTIQYLNYSESAELRHFLATAHSQYQLGYDSMEWERRDQLWNNSFIAVSHGSKILGVTQLWSPSPQKKIVLKNIPQFIKLIGRLTLSRRSPFKVNSEFKVLYMNALTIDPKLEPDRAKEVFNILCHQAWQSPKMKSYHCLAFADFEKNPLRGSLTGFLTNSTPMSLYQVVLRQNSDELKIENDRPINFEMSLV